MAKMVGLSRNLKFYWLSKVVELVSENLSDTEIKQQLNEYLGVDIQSPTNLRKTREILMNIWVYNNGKSSEMRQEALKLIQNHPDCALAIHWCMMLSTYPVFVDFCKLFGKMAEFQDEITLAQFKQKLFEEWGERTTLFHSINKLFATMKDLKVVSVRKPGKFQINKHRVTNPDAVNFMIYTFLLVDNSAYYPFAKLKSSAYFFPFEYQLEKEAILGDERFVVNNFGGELSISLKDKI